jgi:tetratricopeptide (TPR) repeat protein
MEMWTSIADIRKQPLRYTDCDYLLIDYHNYHHGGGWYRWPLGDEVVDKVGELLARGGWRIVVQEKTALLLKRDIACAMPPEQALAAGTRLRDEWMRVQGYYAVHIERGVKATEREDLEHAREEYLKAIETTRPDPYPYSQLCGVSLRLRDFPGALRFGEVVVRLAPYDAFTWYRLALAHAELDRLPDAMRCCQRALRLFPHSAAQRALLAQLYARAGRPAAALRQARLALQIKFDDPDASRVAKTLGILK